jgi:hypothetical protein
MRQNNVLLSKTEAKTKPFGVEVESGGLTLKGKQGLGICSAAKAGIGFSSSELKTVTELCSQTEP